MPDTTSKYLNRPTRSHADALVDQIKKIAEHAPIFEEYATELMGLLWRADNLACCLGVHYPSLDSRWREWHIALVKVAREVRAAQIPVSPRRPRSAPGAG